MKSRIKSVFLGVLAVAFASIANAQVTFNVGTGTINNAGFGADVESSFNISVSGLAGDITNVRLSLAGSLGSPNNLKASLISPSGGNQKTVQLFPFSAAGASTLTLASGFFFDDAASPVFDNLSGTISTPHKPNGGTLSDFDGLAPADANGTWVLKFTSTQVDLTAGSLSSGQLEITAVPEPSAYAAMMGLGMLGFAGFRRFRMRKA